MDKRINRTATLANISAYNEGATNKYIDGAPHIKHTTLRTFYNKLILQIVNYSKQYKKTPKILDLGAGEGSTTLPFLKLGVKVVAVDISNKQLNILKNKCKQYKNQLDVRCEDLNDILDDKNEKYDIVVANSLLHHVPDYLGMIKKMMTKLNLHGQLFFFQDPLRYDTVGMFTIIFSKFAYFCWRVFKGDVKNGLKRHLRRLRGNYQKDSIYDNTEYHVVRNGVDQVAIRQFFKKRKINCSIISYFSTQSYFFQTLGTLLGLKNTFAVIVQKK